MNKSLIVLFGIVVAVHSFSIPVSRDALSEDSSHVEGPSSDDSPSKGSSVEDSHTEVLPLEGSHSEDQLAASQPEESSQAEESHQDQPEESSHVEESHSEDKPAENPLAPELPEEDKPAESSQAEESDQDQPEESSQVEESHSEDQPEESSQVEESHSEDQPEESSQVEESHSEDKPAETPLAPELPEEDLHEENSSAKDEDEEGDEDLPEDYYDDEELKAVSNGLYRFSSEFYKKTAATRPRNLVCSPLSVGVLLAMIAQGARGITEQEMRKGLRLPEDSLVTKHGYQSLIDSINAPKQVEVHLANAVFMNDRIEMTPEFESITEEYFKSPVEKVPFYYQDEASDIINYWVEEKTTGRIKNVVKPADALDAEMVLVNAVYFKGSWQSKFERENTVEKVFNIDNRQYKKVPTMHQENTFNYGVLPDLNSVYVELPYEHLDEDDEMSMFIVLPKETTGLKKLINASEKINFQQLHSNPTLTPVKLYVPKFKARSTMNLQPVLEKMGMRDMFRHKANFTGITISRHLSLTKVVQKAYLEVNEEGGEPAASTAAELNLSTVSSDRKQEPVEMLVDHPFMYVIYHSATNTVLFQGHVKAPALK